MHTSWIIALGFSLAGIFCHCTAKGSPPSSPELAAVTPTRPSAGAGLPTPGTPGTPPPASSGARPENFDSFAQKLVTQVAPIREGHEVMIVGGTRDVELMEDIAVQARRLGAFPIIAHKSERLVRKMFSHVPEKWDTQMPQLTLKLATLLDAHIELDFADSLNYLDGIPPQRQGTRWQANQLEDSIQRRRGMIMVHIGNEMYPTAQRAQLYGLGQDQLAEMFWGGLDVDYSELQKRGEALRQALSAGRELHITHPNGTDFRVQIAGRKVFVSDGVITEEDIRTGALGGTGASAYLPAGEAYLVPVPGSGDGVIVDDVLTVDVPGQRSVDRMIHGMKLTFKGGTVTAKSAGSGMEFYDKGYWDVVGEGRDQLSVIDLGFNPMIRHLPGSRLEVYSASGMITLGLGNQHWAGSDNPASFGVRHYLPGCTVTIDGKVLIENGELKI